MLQTVNSPISYPRFSSTGNPDEDRLAVSPFLQRRWGRGKQGKQQIEVVYLEASAAISVDVVPTADYSGMVVNCITPNRLLPNAFQLTLSHGGVAQHTVVLSGDLMEMPFWAWVTTADPLIVTITNRLAFDGFLGLTLTTISF